MQQRLSPLQVRFGRMLEMNGPEIEDEIRRALDDNPALEVADQPSQENDFNESAEELILADYRSPDDIPPIHYTPTDSDGRFTMPETAAPDASLSLTGTLASQLSESDISESDRLIAQYVIGSLDDNGYLTRSADAIAYDIESATGTHVETDAVTRVIDIVKTLDPAGVAASDLRECLLLQLKRLDSTDPDLSIAVTVIEQYFQLFSLKHYDRLASAIGISRQQLGHVMDIIRSLNPKPAAYITSDPVEERRQHIIPDFYVEADTEGSVTVTLLNSIPDLQIEATFREDTPITDRYARNADETNIFLRQKRDEANDFIRLIGMRQSTLFRIMSAIVALQRPFFTGDEDLSLMQPMILKDVAAITGDDLSVISRATAGKYVATPRATYPLKMFFNERTRADAASDSPVDTTAIAIMEAMKEIIASEDHNRPLSDDAIASILATQGLDVARRTVAKYRQRLGFPVARLRREI